MDCDTECFNRLRACSRILKLQNKGATHCYANVINPFEALRSLLHHSAEPSINSRASEDTTGPGSTFHTLCRESTQPPNHLCGNFRMFALLLALVLLILSNIWNHWWRYVKWLVKKWPNFFKIKNIKKSPLLNGTLVIWYWLHWPLSTYWPHPFLHDPPSTRPLSNIHLNQWGVEVANSCDSRWALLRGPGEKTPAAAVE